jgi:hypothetical protein
MYNSLNDKMRPLETHFIAHEVVNQNSLEADLHLRLFLSAGTLRCLFNFHRGLFALAAMTKSPDLYVILFGDKEQSIAWPASTQRTRS